MRHHGLCDRDGPRGVHHHPRCVPARPRGRALAKEGAFEAIGADFGAQGATGGPAASPSTASGAAEATGGINVPLNHLERTLRLDCDMRCITL